VAHTQDLGNSIDSMLARFCSEQLRVGHTTFRRQYSPDTVLNRFSISSDPSMSLVDLPLWKQPFSCPKR
jgi:hypothetical protein